MLQKREGLTYILNMILALACYHYIFTGLVFLDSV